MGGCLNTFYSFFIEYLSCFPLFLVIYIEGSVVMLKMAKVSKNEISDIGERGYP